MIPSSGPYRVKRRAMTTNPALVYFFLSNLFIPFCTFFPIPAGSRSLIADEEITAIGLIFDVYDIGIVRRWR